MAATRHLSLSIPALSARGAASRRFSNAITSAARRAATSTNFWPSYISRTSQGTPAAHRRPPSWSLRLSTAPRRAGSRRLGLSIPRGILTRLSSWRSLTSREVDG
eukprot:scaffold217669_cov28-Tisochrysis_lutea.AAC.1